MPGDYLIANLIVQKPCCSLLHQAVGYNLIPKNKNSDGLIAVTFNKKFEELVKVQQNVVDSFQKIVLEAVQKIPGNKPTISVCVEGVKQMPDDK